jgi:hypothetical protein
MIFGIQMYHEEMQIIVKYGCCPIIIGEVIALGLRKRIENDSFSVHFLSDGWMDSKDVWYTDLSRIYPFIKWISLIG